MPTNTRRRFGGPGWLRQLAAALLCLWAGVAQALTVQLLGATPGSDEFVAALKARLGPTHDVVVQPDARADVVVALHEGVLAEARALQKPLLVLQPYGSGVPASARETALYWAPSLSDQMRLALRIMPGLRRVGLLVAAHDLARAQALRQAFAGRDIEVVVREANPATLTRQVAELAAVADVLLAPVDGELYNRATLKAVLLAAYRQNRAFIGPNPAYVRAGALASLYATPQELADAAAVAIRSLARDGDWPAPGHVGRFDVVTNPQVGRALGIRLPDADQLSRSLQSEKGVPWP